MARIESPLTSEIIPEFFRTGSIGTENSQILSGIYAEFERDLISERVKSGLAVARTGGRKLGRQPEQRPKSDRLAPKVIALIDEGCSYRWIARDLGISKNTVMDIVNRNREVAWSGASSP